MSEEIRRLERRRIATDLLATALGVAGLAVYLLRGFRPALYLGAYGLLVGTSTGVVTFCLTRFTGIAIGGPAPGTEPDTETPPDDADGPAAPSDDANGPAAPSDDADGPAAPPDDEQSGAGTAGGPAPWAVPWRVFTGKALESDADVQEDTGWLIGRLENVVVLTLVIAGAYTALSIIFAAKSWVRREDITRENTTYYLAGTLVNFTYSIAVGIATVRLPGLL